MGADCRGLHFTDIETFHPYYDLRRVGAAVYAREAEIILCSDAEGEGEVALWEYGQDPAELKQRLARAKMRVAHNAFFEQSVFRATGWCKAPPEGWHCTMAQAYAHAMPGKLDALCRYLDVPMEMRKKGEGQRLINIFCKPQRDGRRVLPTDRPVEWEAFKHYARSDTIALREVYRRLPQLNLNPYGPPTERALWLLDQKINRRGFKVDVELAKAAVKACAKEKAELDAFISTLTQGSITSGTQRARVLERLQTAGLEIENLKAITVERALNNEDLQGEFRSLLETRRTVSKASTGKYKKLLSYVSRDGRMRGGLQFAGAGRTARWAGRNFQPHNMPRPKRKFEAILEGIAALKAGCADLIEPDVHSLCSDALRSLLIAADGKTLVVADENAIEGRVLAWLANETWKLELYRDPDADMYTKLYRRMFGYPDTFEVDKDKRQHGKVFELAYGYEGGVGATLTACDTYKLTKAERNALGEAAWRAATPNIRRAALKLWEFAEERGETHGLSRKLYCHLEAAKLIWRSIAPNTKKLWRLLKDAAENAINTPGKKFFAGRCVFMFKGNYLYCRLPSGRYLMYRDAKRRKTQRGYAITYVGSYGGREYLYGGKLAENITQALARDVLGHGMLKADAAGFALILTIHDEIIAEEDRPELDLERLKQIMTITPAWAEGLPLKAAGYESTRYKKE